MFVDRLRVGVPNARRTLWVAASGFLAILPAFAQGVPLTGASALAGSTSAGNTSTGSASAAVGELTPADRAKRDADGVFRWITIHGDKPRKPAAVKEEKPPTVVRLKPAPRPSAPSDTATSQPLAARPSAAKSEAAATATTASATIPAPTTSNASIDSAAQRSTAPNTSAPAVSAAEAIDDALTVISQAEPKFPISLIRTMRSGQVQVQFTVLPDGSVSEPIVVTSTNSRLNPAALAAVRQWRFAPLRNPQQAVVDVGFNNTE